MNFILCAWMSCESLFCYLIDLEIFKPKNTPGAPTRLKHKTVLKEQYQPSKLPRISKKIAGPAKEMHDRTHKETIYWEWGSAW